jgi:hypothetical protein
VPDIATPLSFGRITSQEIVSQPECWAQAQALGRPAGLHAEPRPRT